MELYTSLVRLKQAMNGGQMPPMTPLDAAARKVVDPSLTIGMGALTEDEERGLRCPVRGCGEWHHFLGLHVRQRHSGIGGVPGLRAALSIPASAPLLSRRALARFRDTHRIFAAGNMAAQRSGQHAARRRPKDFGRRVSSGRLAIGTKNLRNMCVAQLAHRITDLANYLGRSPTLTEFRAKYGGAVASAVFRTFGSWASAKAQVGLVVYRGGHGPARKEVTRDAVLESLAIWHRVHGDLPVAEDAARGEKTPYIPAPKTILRALGTSSWPEAMQRAAAILNIYGGRYGLPEKRAS